MMNPHPERTCLSCDAYSSDPRVASGSVLGECRQLPPTVFTETDEFFERSLWPKVEPDDWCRRWNPIVNLT